MRMRFGGGRFGCGDIPAAVFAMKFGGRDGGRGGWGGGGDWGEGSWGGGWGGGRRGRSRRMFESGELRLVLLKLIADQPRHGYDLIRAVEELTGGAYAPSPGVVYPTLTMLQEMGQIEEASAEGARKAFQVTEDGRKQLEEKAQEIEDLFQRLSELGEGRRRTGGAPIGRAVGNLMTALSHRIQRDGINEATLHDIASVLDEAAQKIERL